MGRIDLKVVLLGNGYAGKTSLHERFIRGRFNTGLPYQNTIGGAFAAKAVDSSLAKVFLFLFNAILIELLDLIVFVLFFRMAN